MTYILWSSDFASYLEDYLMEKRIWDNGSVWLKDRPCKIYVGQWPIFHGPLILPYIIVRLKLFLYIKKWHRPGVFVPLRALSLVAAKIEPLKFRTYLLNLSFSRPLQLMKINSTESYVFFLARTYRARIQLSFTNTRGRGIQYSPYINLCVSPYRVPNLTLRTKYKYTNEH